MLAKALRLVLSQSNVNSPGPLRVIVGERNHRRVLVQLARALLPGGPRLGSLQALLLIRLGQLLVVSRDEVSALGLGNLVEVRLPRVRPDVCRSAENPHELAHGTLHPGRTTRAPSGGGGRCHGERVQRSGRGASASTRATASSPWPVSFRSSILQLKLLTTNRRRRATSRYQASRARAQCRRQDPRSCSLSARPSCCQLPANPL